MTQFLEYCSTFKMNGVQPKVIQLILFPFSLMDRAKRWFTSLPPNSINTWQELYNAFFNKYFPPTKVLKIRNEINSFYQRDDESFYECWDRFKDLQRQCPPQLIPSWDLVQSFYKGVNPSVQVNIDAAAGGTIMFKTHEDTLDQRLCVLAISLKRFSASSGVLDMMVLSAAASIFTRTEGLTPL